jgi:hypothetical protein
LKDNNHDIDNFLRDHLSEREFDGPPKEFMDDLNKRLDERQSKFLFGPWNGLIDILVIILLISGSIFTQDHSQTESIVSKGNNTSTSNIEQGVANTITPDENAKTTVGSNQNETPIAEKTGIDKTSSSELFEDASTLNTMQRKIASQAIPTTQKNENDSYTSNKSGSTNKLSNSNMSQVDDSTLEGQQSPNNKSKATIVSNNSSDRDASIEITQDINNPSSKQVRAANGKDNNDASEKELKTFEIDKRSDNYVNYPVLASQYKLVEPKIRNWNFPSLPTSSFEEEDIKTISNTNSLQSSLSFEAQLHSGVSLGRLTNPAGSNPGENILNSQSDLSPTFTLGGRISLWYKNAVFTSGLDLAKIKEDNLFELNEVNSYDSTFILSIDSTLIFDSTNQIVDTIYTYNYDSVTVTDTTVIMTPVNQQYTWLQIPLQFGYKFNFNKWAIIPRVGANLAIGINSTTKKYPDASFNSLENYPTQTKILFNLTGSLEFRRSFGKMHAFVRGDYQSGMRPVITGDYFERRYGAMRINLGVGIKL